MRWLLLKDLQILRRSPLLVALLFGYAGLVGAVVGIAVSPDNVASLGVIGQFGFQQVGVQIDDIDGEELVFDLDQWPPPGAAAMG